MKNIASKIIISIIALAILSFLLSLPVLYLFSDKEKHGHISNTSELDYLIIMPFKDLPNNGQMYYEYQLFFPRFNKEIKIYGEIKVPLMEKFVKQNLFTSKIFEDYLFNEKEIPSILNWNLPRDKYQKLPVFSGKVYILDTHWGGRSVRFIISSESGKFIARISDGSSKT